MGPAPPSHNSKEEDMACRLGWVESRAALSEVLCRLGCLFEKGQRLGRKKWFAGGFGGHEIQQGYGHHCPHGFALDWGA